ncbi:diguanylate cyclase domain-containing protein [Pseudanabaena sp. PCC 6802]|uniref:diguanylate cyclase domain-containing protein n=1 Tax=Pseudanabaena sp. PCC 6802 TaxID=118173 RepID=UPI000344DB88|nr:diguanylate cyclase [Pseudanabaena sp. PCC 6802]
MDTFSEFKDLMQIHDGDNSRVYRARRVKDGRSLILKILKAEHPTPSQIRRYRQEYRLTYQLQMPNIIKAYGLEEWQKTLVMIVEDFGGISLDQWLQQRQQSLTVGEFLPLALKIVDGIAQLHSQNIIHKDINPANLVFNPKTGLLKLIDLGISTQLSRENPTPSTPNALEGTFPYLSPEQTGRMNRSLDYRTDFYSLGITFYEVLTGTLPFTSSDPMELVHCHIAKQPVPPHLLAHTKIPKAISDIVMKLLAKNAEDRYQSSRGLQTDIEKCLGQWEKTGAIAPFTLGCNDISDLLQIPQKLYGREREIAALLTAFDRVACPEDNCVTVQGQVTSAAGLIVVTGYAGIGKSALVKEICKPITAKRGYFISGKFDQFQRNIPYSALVNAFASLVKQLLGETEAILKQWRDRLLAALGANGQVIIDVIPEVELIIGVQPEVPSLGASESQHRFNLAFQHFIQAFCSPERPLAIFLDDLQWADLATLNAIERLLGDRQIDSLLLIVAYRDREVSESHPITHMLAQLRQKRVNLETINLTPLRLSHVEQLMAETLHSETQAVSSLAELVMRKTEGNPFFVNEFLKTLYSDNLLAFDRTIGKWHWDVAQIEAMGFTHNVVEMMVGQLQKLPPSVQKVLSLTACLGSKFDLDTIALVEERMNAEVFVDIKTAMERGFLLPRSPLDENLLIQDYQFGHDRIQQAAYYLIPKVERESIHYKIGKLLRQHWSPKVREEQIFVIVNHLNHGIALITDQIDRDRLAKLNLMACRKARMAIAYQAAGEYAAIALNLLGSAAWQRQYETALALHELAAEVALLCGEFDQMNRWVDAAINRARTPLEQVGVYLVRIQALSIHNRLSEAISVGHSILTELGVRLPNPPSSEEIQQAVREINSSIGDRTIEELFHLPAMVEREKLAIMQVAAAIGPACFMLGSPLFPPLIALLVNLSIRYGNSTASAYGYACYGLFLNSFLQDASTSGQFGRLAYRLASISDAKNMRSETFAIVGLFLHHRQAHLRETLPILKAGYQAGLEAGNLGFVGHNGNGFCINSFWCGKPLAELETQIRSYHRQFLDYNQFTAANYCSIYWESIHFLLGSPDAIEFSSSQGQIFDSKNSAAIFQFHLYKAVLRFLIGDIALASADIAQARLYLAAGVQTITEAIFYFYDSLIALATLPKLDAELAPQWQRVQANQARLHHWAEHAPMNYLHKWQLVEAETCRVLDRKLEAIELYDRVIAGAMEQQYIQEEALANELAAKFYLDWGKENIARTYMLDARYCYLRWGSIAKVEQLDAHYPQLLKFPGYQASSHPFATAQIATGGRSGAELDLTTVMKASQAIATEIVLEKLLQTLMQILLENAGAQTGCLLLHTPLDSGELGTFAIAARSSTDPDRASLSQSIGEIMPESVLYYVARTQESILLDSAVESGNFAHDPYIQSAKPLSVLCYPLIDRGKLVAIIYLENNLTTGAFTANRIELLQLLSGQAAIALENAILYAEKAEYTRTLEQKVRERTAELQRANQELSNLVNLDGLTQIANRRHFDRYFAREWQRHLRSQEPLALILIDIDYFKRYNDCYGHQRGDDCLLQVARAIAKVLQRPTDLVARYGGEEFAVILPNTSTDGASTVAESIRRAIATLTIPHADSAVSQHVTLSLGIASFIPTPDTSTENLIANADRALYAAKYQGRDRASICH